MAGRLAIRRLWLSGLAPRDHPSPRNLEMKLAEAARLALASELGRALADWSGPEVLRVKRLEVDIAMDATFDPDLFAALLARAIVSALHRAGGEGVVAFPTRAAHLAAFVEALAAGRAWQCWWLREAEGLRALPTGAAIRTALTADSRLGLAALASLPPLRLAMVLEALGPGEADRLLHEFSAGGCVTGAPEAAVAAFLETLAGGGVAAELAAGSTLPVEARRTVVHHLAASRRDAAVEPERLSGCLFTRFGGLFLLLPTLGYDDIAETTAGWPEAPDPRSAALISYAALGLCAGGSRFAVWLADPLWRELFGLPLHDPPVAFSERLSAIPRWGWDRLQELVPTLAGTPDARFLLPPGTLVTSRPTRRALARLAGAILARFARRLVGFSASSAPFLWQNLLAVPAMVERAGSGWQARLGRPPLDVLLSLSRLAEGEMSLPSGATVRLTRASP